MKIMSISTYKTLLPLSCAILFGAIVPGEVVAQGLPVPFLEYAAKFACGQVTVTPASGDTDAVQGVYATSINIHNPQSKLKVQLFKKVVIANEAGSRRGQIQVLPSEVLPPDQAERVDCPLIFQLFNISPQTYTEGFVVIEIPFITTVQQGTTLDVVGKYSARPADGEVSCFNIVIYSPKVIVN
jgi:hypothetical protein